MTIAQFNLDILAWLNDYKGPHFHAILSDPPYHLTSIVKRFGKPDAAPAKSGVYKRTSRGFMGQTWDGGEIAFNSEMWHALGEILYPGAFMFIYAGTRTYHRVAAAIEEAGFIIHPPIGWVTCLSEDTEILTSEGWKTYDLLSVGSSVMCYSMKDKTYNYMPTEEVVSYDYDDTAYNIKSDSTDQIVTPNHRVIVKRRGKQIFKYASTLECKENVPVLESLWRVRKIIYRDELGRVLEEDDLRLNEVQESAPVAPTPNGAQREGDNLSRVRERSLQKIIGTEENLIYTDMLEAMQRYFEGERVGEEIRRRNSQGEISIGERTQETEQAVDGGQESVVEGRSSLLSQAWKLCSSKIRALSSRIFGHGSKGWVCDGAQIVSGAIIGTPIVKRRSGTSYQSQSAGQSDRESDVVLEQFLSQELREQWIPSTTLASVTPIRYKGKVWCIRVPTGAFVARRNGMVFVTGNSQGFPKATRIDTQIDRKAGAKREKVGEPKTGVASGTHRHTGIDGSWGYNDDYYETAPVTPMAQVWAGYRYGLMALKPSFEFILCAQRPYDGSPLSNITGNGAGALNIDGARITKTIDDRLEYGVEGIDREKYNHTKNVYGKQSGVMHYDGRQGRWPSNLVLQHLPECVKVGEKETVYPINRFTDGAKPFGHGAGHNYETVNQTAMVDIYECAEGCPVRRLNEQSAQWNSGRDLSQVFYTVPPTETEDMAVYVPKVTPKERDAGLEDFPVQKVSSRLGNERPSRSKKPITEQDEHWEKRAKNTHPTLKPIQLNKWLATLLLPPDYYAPRRILVPFAGVLSEAIGAELAGWEEVVAIELIPEYIPLGKARAEYWIRQKAVTAKSTRAERAQLSFLDEK